MPPTFLKKPPTLFSRSQTKWIKANCYSSSALDKHCVPSASPQPCPSDTLPELQSMCLPFLEAVNTVIKKAKLRASAAPPDCLQPPASTRPTPPPSAGESLGRRIPLYKLRSCDPLVQAGWQAHCRGEDDERGWGWGGFFAFISCSSHLCVLHSLFSSLSLPLAVCLSVSLPLWLVCRARPALFCSVGLWTLAAACQRRESHCSGGWGEHTTIHIKPLLCRTRKPFMDWHASVVIQIKDLHLCICPYGNRAFACINYFIFIEGSVSGQTTDKLPKTQSVHLLLAN